ncbi:MATE family efflux transporter [Mycoplasmopsis iners]|uniref:MATE family efflux transporter n=1 Tax=Mycoplasmopsis iners TaxID=76630 RepID=UPI0004983F76|nr:MATE family efflux transporter [Mycoplasmopsis iners]
MNSKTKDSSRAEQLFAKTPVKKAIWIVAIPSLMITLMIGLYSFADQVFIQQFVPRTRIVLSNNQIGEIMPFLSFGNTASFDEYFALLQKYNSIEGITKLTTITSNTVVSTTNAAFQPLIIFSNSIVFLIPVGASVYYTKCLSKKLEWAAKNLWATMFWCTFTLSLIATICSLIFTAAGFQALLAGKTVLENSKALSGGMNQLELNHLQDYYNAAYQLSIQWANHYVYIYAAGTVLQGLVSLFSYFIRAEGFNFYVMFIGILANFINIGLDALLIIVFKMGVLGGVVATIIGWAFNLTAYVIYVQIKHRKKQIWMSLGKLFNFQFNKSLLGPTFLLGLSGFIRSFGVAFSFAMINIVLSKPAFADPGHFQFYWAKSTPIITLFIISIFGISDGARSLLSYNYTQRNFERCKQVYLWALIVSLTYSLVVYIFVALTAGNLWTLALNVSDEMKAETANFIRVLTIRLVIMSLTVTSLLVFQGTNDIEKSLIATTLENFISFAIIIPIGLGLAYWAYHSTDNKYLANWIVVGSFILNSVIASTILLVFSYNYVTKKLVKIDQTKLSWSRKIEHKFFDNVAKLEQEYYLKHPKASH